MLYDDMYSHDTVDTLPLEMELVTSFSLSYSVLSSFIIDKGN